MRWWRTCQSRRRCLPSRKWCPQPPPTLRSLRGCGRCDLGEGAHTRTPTSLQSPTKSVLCPAAERYLKGTSGQTARTRGRGGRRHAPVIYDRSHELAQGEATPTLTGVWVDGVRGAGGG